MYIVQNFVSVPVGKKSLIALNLFVQNFSESTVFRIISMNK